MNRAEPENEFIYGVMMGEIDKVWAALDSGVPVDAPLFGHGATALLWAVAKGEEMVRLLLERGAAINVEDWEGVTPLQNTIRAKNLPMVELLVEHGADPTYRTSFGTALDVAREEGTTEIVALLERTAADR
jgi:ankyrin repeat protein